MLSEDTRSNTNRGLSPVGVSGAINDSRTHRHAAAINAIAVLGLFFVSAYPVARFILSILFLISFSSFTPVVSSEPSEMFFRLLGFIAKVPFAVYLVLIAFHFVGLAMTAFTLGVRKTHPRWYYIGLWINCFLWLFCGVLHAFSAILLCIFLMRSPGKVGGEVTSAVQM